MQPLIVLEFNELCPPLLAKWMASGDLPNFRRFYEASDVFTTSPDVEDPAELEPWIQWYSVHTGKPYSEHGVFHLTDGPGAGDDDIWQILNRAGVTTGNVSSMNAKLTPSPGSFGMPDPWCTTEKSFPPALQPFQDFVQEQVQEYSNTSRSNKAAEFAKLAAFLATNGLRAQTALGLIRQIAAEKTSGGAAYWKRAVQLDWLLMDVFRHYWRKYHPGYATFFLNSTAHYQHAYWRHMAPESFQHAAPAGEEAKYRDAILFGYQNMDRLIGEFFRLEEQGATLVLMTALSQQPFLKYEDIGGQNFYRPRNIEAMLSVLGITASDVQPVMTHQYKLRIDDAAAREKAAATLASLRVDGRQVFEVGNEDDGIYFGCQLRTGLSPDTKLIMGNAEVSFFDQFYQIEGTKSGCHHPDGVLWVKGGRHQRHDEKVSILDWFPTVLDYYGIEGGTAYGTSLLPRLAPDMSSLAA